MIDLLLLLAALFFGLLTVYSRDNVYSAVSLASAAGAVGAYYAYLAQFASAFLIFVIYIGAVMLLVIITAAMYGGVQKWGGRYSLASTLVFLAAAALGALLWEAPPAKPVQVQLGDLLTAVIMLIGVAAVSLLVSIEVSKRT
jgi:NADH-quinone oxidoreductase subunit J